MAIQRRKAIRRSGSDCYTEPDFPVRVVVREGDVEILNFYYGGDHPPPHLHLVGGGDTVKIGQMGFPIRRGDVLTARQRAVVGKHRAAVRKAIRKIARYHWFHQLGDK